MNNETHIFLCINIFVAIKKNYVYYYSHNFYVHQYLKICNYKKRTM